MPLAQLITFIPVQEQRMRVSHPCVLLKEGAFWCVLDPENNNELIKQASTSFIRNEITAGRLVVEAGWDMREPQESKIDTLSSSDLNSEYE